MAEIIITTNDQLYEVQKRATMDGLAEFEAQRKARENMRLYTKNQVAKITGKAHATISKMLRDGVIKGTVDGLIPEVELQRYLAGK